MQTDDQIVDRVLAGEPDQFGVLVQRYEGLVTASARQILGDYHEAQDAAQDTFVRAYCRLDQLRDRLRIAGWLRRITHSVCMNRVKGAAAPAGELRGAAGQAGVVELPDRGPGPDERAQARELTEAVLASVAQLPQEYGEPVRMYYLEGASQAEIARRLGLRAGAVRTRLHRGRKLLEPRLLAHSPVEAYSRSKQQRPWLPTNLRDQEEEDMSLHYEQTRRELLRGQAQVVIRPMEEGDIPAMRRFDDELGAALEVDNSERVPGNESTPGGPWSQDDWLRAHFARYAERGCLTLLAEEEGRIVGFADLWVADEPEPFGRSLDVECIDYFRPHYLAGLETVLLQEAEKVAMDAGLPALDIGTNTSSGDYPALRRLGMKVFYEYDELLFRCERDEGSAAVQGVSLEADAAYLSGLIKVSHWSPTDFTFRDDEDQWSATELSPSGHRAVLELWRYEPGNAPDPPIPPGTPNRTELYAEPDVLASAEAMSEVLRNCAAIAAKHGATQIELPCPSDIEVDAGSLGVLERRFAYAWMRKPLAL